LRTVRYTHRMVPAIVLAAGRSSRFGQAKALARAAEGSFISQILHALSEAGVVERVVVCRDGDRELATEIAKVMPPARVVVNPDPDRGQLSSLLAGLDAVDHAGVAGVVVMLVDMPLVRAPTIRRIIEVAASSPAAVIRASYAGRHGHPVVFKRAAFEALRRADPSVGAKAVVHAMETAEVDVDDLGVVEDVDTPADYERLFGRRV
jgi:molybdenum cofactor cytidylyltransferase